jgi:hypothetical protein
MLSPHLATVRAKIDRAQIHSHAIDAALKLVLGTKPEIRNVATELDFKRQEIISTIQKVEPIEPTLPLMIGDCIHNLRSALDTNSPLSMDPLENPPIRRSFRSA